MKASLFILLLIILLNYEANSVPTRFPPRTSRPTQPPTAGSTTTTRDSTTRLITTHSTTKGSTTTESTTTSSTTKPLQTTSTIIHLKPTETEKTSPTIQSTVSPNKLTTKLTTKLTNSVIKKTNSVEGNLNNTVECGPGTYKCHGVQSHCIMITQICDAKQDCPFGDDESISCLPIVKPIQSSPIDLQRSSTNYISGTGFMFNVGNIIMTGNAKVRMFNQNSDNIALPDGGVVNVN